MGMLREHEIGLSLFHKAELPQKFWTYAFTATYLINRLSTPILQNIYLFHILFQWLQHYEKFKTFDFFMLFMAQALCK